MDARGLVAVIFTVHEAAAALGVLAVVLIAAVGALIFRHAPAGRRLLTVLAFAVGGGLITFGAISRLLDVAAVDVEVVRVGR